MKSGDANKENDLSITSQAQNRVLNFIISQLKLNWL